MAETPSRRTTRKKTTPKPPPKAEPKPPAQADVKTDAAEAVTYTIDELAVTSGTPSRTIRFYQSRGLLSRPTIRRRKALYSQDHLERLKLIGTLQDRGLRIRAIQDLVQRIDRGELVLEDWLGLEEKMQASWANDEPQVFSTEELNKLIGSDRSGVIAELVRLGLLERRGTSYVASSPALLETILRMNSAGVELEVAREGVDIARRHLSRLARELVEHCYAHAGEGFGRSASPQDLGVAFEALRPHGSEVVVTVFGQEMESLLRDLVESGKATQVAARDSSRRPWVIAREAVARAFPIAEIADALTSSAESVAEVLTTSAENVANTLTVAAQSEKS